MSEALLVLVGGAVGALLRWGLALLGRSPWSTLAANVTGSLLLGLVVTVAPPWVVTLVGVGVAGALTTWSTFALEAVTRPRGRAALYVLVTLAAGGCAFGLGTLLGRLA